MDVKDIAVLLDKYPDIKQRLKEMLDIVEGPNRGNLIQQMPWKSGHWVLLET